MSGSLNSHSLFQGIQMAKLTVKNISLFSNFLGAICKLVNSCKFIIDENECTVMSVDESKVFRVYFKTNSIVSDEKVEFCLGELNKFNRSISTLKDFKGDDNTSEITFDGNFLKSKDKVKFSLKLIKEEVIKRLIATEMKMKLETTHGFTLSNVLMKKFCSMTFITIDENSHKVYLYKENDAIVGELNNKAANICDSISIPISNDYFGEWSTPILTKLDTFRLWNLLDAPEIKINIVKQGAYIIHNEVCKDDLYVKIKIVCPMAKK